MMDLSKLEQLDKTIAGILDNICILEQKVGPIVTLLNPAVAPEVAMATGIAKVTQAAIEAHVAAGSTPQSAAVAMNSIAQAVATSGAIDAGTAEQVKLLAPAVAGLAPDLLQSLQQA